ncbi:MAG TPA: pyruvate kinase, partial [Corynebacterium sp.]|nr:pyruvate kinase [Corynebacterium sp.]
MDQRLLDDTITKIDSLLEKLAEAEAANQDAIDQVHACHRDGAINLVHYTELRAHDIRPLQARLSEVGATRLTTTEPSVVPRLQAARNVLSAYAGQELKFGGSAVAQAFNRADDILEDNADRLLGEHVDGTHSRIMVTLPTEAGEDPDLV